MPRTKKEVAEPKTEPSEPKPTPKRTPVPRPPYKSERTYDAVDVLANDLGGRFHIAENYEGRNIGNAKCLPKSKNAEKVADKLGLKPVCVQSKNENGDDVHDPTKHSNCDKEYKGITVNKYVKNTEKKIEKEKKEAN